MGVRIKFEDKIETARLYLKALKKTCFLGWETVYDDYIKNKNFPIYEKLTLIHPCHFENLDLSKKDLESTQVEIQGPRKFFLNNHSVCNCGAELIWGYLCVTEENFVEDDHLFPYSLGGPTIKKNRISLCRYHNQVKGSDIHLYPWDKFATYLEPWLDRQISKYAEKYKQLSS